jgi:hypothetical protein
VAPPKNGAALIALLGKPKKGPKSEPVPSEGDEELDDKADAMRDLGEALSAKDWDGAAMAFERAYEVCAMKHESSDEEEEPAEEGRY